MAGKKSSTKKGDKNEQPPVKNTEAKSLEPEPEVKEKAPKPKAEPTPDPAPPRAIPSKAVTELVTAKCLVTKTKFIVNRWWKLERGEEITAPKVVVDTLRNAGLVK